MDNNIETTSLNNEAKKNQMIPDEIYTGLREMGYEN